MKKILSTLFLVAGYTFLVPQISYADEAAASVNKDAVVKENTNQAINSGTVTVNVKAKLLTTPGIDSSKIKVISRTSKKNPHMVVVTLIGSQTSQDLVKKAGKVAKSVEDVGKVRNKLKVSKE